MIDLIFEVIGAVWLAMAFLPIFIVENSSRPQ
jgi:hypothetical protein